MLYCYTHNVIKNLIDQNRLTLLENKFPGCLLVYRTPVEVIYGMIISVSTKDVNILWMYP